MFCFNGRLHQKNTKPHSLKVASIFTPRRACRQESYRNWACTQLSPYTSLVGNMPLPSAAPLYHFISAIILLSIHKDCQPHLTNRNRTNPTCTHTHSLGYIYGSEHHSRPQFSLVIRKSFSKSTTQIDPTASQSKLGPCLLCATTNLLHQMPSSHVRKKKGGGWLTVNVNPKNS